MVYIGIYSMYRLGPTRLNQSVWSMILANIDTAASTTAATFTTLVFTGTALLYQMMPYCHTLALPPKTYTRCLRYHRVGIQSVIAPSLETFAYVMYYAHDILSKRTLTC